MYGKKKKNISGITLVELVIAMGIMGIVMAIIFNLFVFSSKTFIKGDKQYEIQSDMRIAMDSVVNHIRTATQVTLLSGDDSKAEIAGSQPFNYFFIDGTALYHAKYDESKDSHTILKITDKLAPDNSEFTRIKDDLLGITLASENSGQTYLVNSETLLMNFSLLNKRIEGPGQEKGIKYLTETSAEIILPTVAPSPTPTATPPPQTSPPPTPPPEPSPTPTPPAQPTPTPLPNYPLWDATKSYPAGSYVIYNGAVYYARHYVSKDIVPGTMNSPWQEITDEWRPFNVYEKGDIVIYNGVRYQAKWWTSGDPPDSSNAWEPYEG